MKPFAVIFSVGSLFPGDLYRVDDKYLAGHALPFRGGSIP